MAIGGEGHQTPFPDSVFTQNALLQVLLRTWGEDEVETLTASVSFGLTL